MSEDKTTKHYTVGAGPLILVVGLVAVWWHTSLNGIRRDLGLAYQSLPFVEAFRERQDSVGVAIQVGDTILQLCVEHTRNQNDPDEEPTMQDSTVLRCIVIEPPDN